MYIDQIMYIEQSFLRYFCCRLKLAQIAKYSSVLKSVAICAQQILKQCHIAPPSLRPPPPIPSPILPQIQC